MKYQGIIAKSNSDNHSITSIPLLTVYLSVDNNMAEFMYGVCNVTESA